MPAIPPPITPPPLTERERELRDALPRPARPKKAATIMLWRGPKGNPSILMGKRASRHDFMPSVYVFPGGRVDRADSYAGSTGQMSARTAAVLAAAYSPRRARAVVLAAVRETYEETALMLGAPSARTYNSPSRNPKNASYQAFFDAGQAPDISGIEVVGRAVTPPRRHKRFDTWFFAKDMNGADDISVSDSRELLDVGWFTLEQIKALKTHVATETMLTVLARFLVQDNPPPKIFFMRRERSGFTTGLFPL